MRVLVAMSGGVDSSVAAALVPSGSVASRWWGLPSSCGAVPRILAAARSPMWRTPGGWPTSWDWSTTSSISPPSSRSGWSSPMSGGTPRAAPPIPASSATGTSSSTACSSGPATLGFDAVATGHHARCEVTPDGRFRLCRGADPLKDQSYVLAMLGQDQLARTLFPVGEMTKAQVRRRPAARTADRRQARQPGRLLHPIGRGSGEASSAPTAAPRRPPGRP